MRALDSLHLAIAPDLRLRGHIDSIIASGNALCRVALMERLAAINPELSAN